MFKKLLVILPFVFVFLASVYQPFDADLGWHLKYGEYFFQHGSILRDNIFSTEMPNYKWVNSSWATDLLSYFTYHHFGFLGLSLLSALVVSATFFFFSKAFKLSLWQQTLLFPIVVYFLSPVISVSFRGQLLSLMFLGILCWLIGLYHDKKSKKITWLFPLLFIVWSNFHGEFLLGLGFLGLWLGFNFLSLIWYKTSKKNLLRELQWSVVIFISCTIAVLVNPFGVGVYQEALRHFGNPWDRYIVEWLPFEELSYFWWNQVIISFLIFFGVLFIIFNESPKEKLPWIGLTVVVLAFSFAVRRYSWPMYLLSLSLIYPLPSFFKPDSEKVVRISAAVILTGLIIFTAWLKYPYSQYSNYSWDDYCRTYIGCSKGAVEFLIANHLDQGLLTFYDWGGWMIWNYPQIKPSIDGRMDLWQETSGYSAFAYYYPFEQNITDIDRSKYKVVLMSKVKPMANRLAELASQGKWKLVYSDQTAVVYIRLKEHIE